MKSIGYFLVRDSQMLCVQEIYPFINASGKHPFSCLKKKDDTQHEIVPATEERKNIL
jgi:hypothetical protein